MSLSPTHRVFISIDPLITTTKTHQFSTLDHAFLRRNPLPPPPDIKMIAFQSVPYASLRDLLPISPPPPSVSFPTYNSSWYKIAIENPPVKHAALANLQPMSSQPELGDKGLLGKLKDSCRCFCWLGSIISQVLREVFHR